MDALVTATAADALVFGLEFFARVSIKRATSRWRHPIRGRGTVEGEIRSTAEGISKLVSSEAREWRALPDFFRSSECRTILRQLYAAELVGQSADLSIDIQQEFNRLARLSAGNDYPDYLLSQTFRLLVNGVERVVVAGVSEGVLAAHEARSQQRHEKSEETASRRHKIIVGQLAAINQNLEFVARGQAPSQEDLRDYFNRARAQVADRHSRMTPQQIDAARRVPIDELYVSPRLSPVLHGREGLAATVPLDRFAQLLRRAVVIGTPGGGKSTLAAKLCYDYSRRPLPSLRVEVVPLLIVLREYGSAKRSTRCSILQFIETTLTTRYQVPPPLGAIEYFLRYGLAMVVFDGLDELLDSGYRREITGDVESFVNLYPFAPVLVTSREIGYEQAPLDGRLFDSYRLAAFDDGEVTNYASNWFRVTEDDPAEGERKATAFVAESRPVAELRENPLLLSLMCSIYRDEGYIPRNRPEIYQRCSDMLLERWDRLRSVTREPLRPHVEGLLRFMAYWIYSHPDLRNGTTQDILVNAATCYLRQQRFETDWQARRAAEEFIDLCRNRAWVFTDTGSTSEGLPLYQFTHQTFLEYFTASYLVANFPTPGQLGDVIAPRIANREWDVVAQLAFQQQSRVVAGAADELLTIVASRGAQAPADEAFNLLDFVVRCLQFMFPHERTVATIVAIVVQALVEREWTAERRFSLLGNLVSVASENQPIVVATFAADLSSRRSDPILTLADRAMGMATAAEIIVSGTADSAALSNSATKALTPVERKAWHKADEDVQTAFSERIGLDCRKSFWMAYVGYCAGSVTFDELLEAHGSEGVFRRVRPPGFETCDLGDLAGILFQGILSSDAQNSGRQHLESLGRFLALTNTPWFTNIETTATETTAIVKSLVRARGIETLEGDLLFGAFAILAGLVESAVDLQLRDEIAVDMQDAKSASVMSLAPFVRARLRYAGLPGENLNPSVSESQLAIVRDWANGKLSVVSSRQRPPISAPTRAVVGGRRGRLGGDGGATVAPTRRNPRPRKAAPS